MTTCTFCGSTMGFGTGTLLVRNDGKMIWFCSSKCEKNSLKLKRKPAKLKWVTSSNKVKK